MPAQGLELSARPPRQGQVDALQGVPLLLVVSLMVEQDSADAAGVSWPWAVGGAAIAVVGIVVGGRYGLPRLALSS